MASAAKALVEKLTEIEVKLLKKSLSWPKDYFDSEFGENKHFSIVHQASKKAGVIRRERIERWARNIHAKLSV